MQALLSGRRFSLRKVLRWLVLFCVLPASLVCAALVYSLYQIQLRNVQQNTLLTAQTLMAALEREMATIEAAMKVLATAPELGTGDLAAFHKRARDALASGVVYNYILTDAEGRQVLNTLLPYGTPLPDSGTPQQISRVFGERVTVLTDLFILETAVGHVRMGRHGDVLGRRDNAAGYCPQGGATPPARPRAAQSGV